MFITLEGIEGSGKSSQALLIRQYLKSLELDVVHTREPGGTFIAETIRKIILKNNYNGENLTFEAELLLMFAARSQHLANLIIPALAQHKWVLCERFTDASLAYQGGGRGIDFTYIASLVKLVQGDLKPDLVLLFDVSIDIALKRINSRKNLDRIEQAEPAFFQKVRETYLKLAKSDPSRYYIIDGSKEISEVNQQVLTILRNFLT